MKRLKSIDQFDSLRKKLSEKKDESIPTIIIPAGTCGQASGANTLIRVAKREMLQRNLLGKVELRITGCHGFCEMEPSVLIEPANTFYPKLNGKDMARIVEAVSEGRVVEDLLYKDPDTGLSIEKQNDMPFFKNQNRLILADSHKIDPIRIYEYIENRGYESLAKVLSKSDPNWTIEEVTASGLRGRGGAGFLTGLKWGFLAKQKHGDEKYIICNADEGDPGAYMDRSMLEGNPHSIIEGMVIGAFATGATKGVVYVRAEYPLAIKHLKIALRQARELGLLGENILGTGFSFDISMVKGAGAFVCGEETALIRSIEGKMGEPRQRPPFPVQKGINGNPSSINNVETWANVPIIFKNGAKRFAAIGAENNAGTKIFSLVGKVKNTGLVEVPIGVPIKDIVFKVGGGSSSDRKIKAIQSGGPSGGCIPAERFDLNVDYETLAKAGAIMGSGGMIVMDESTCMVDLAKYFMTFLKDESCGKCFTCRKGTQRMYEILDDISKGKATLKHLDLLEELALTVKDTTMCGLGQTASNPVLSTLRYFRKEYERHILQKKCDAFVCKELVGVPCQAACPVGTEVWRYVALLEKRKYKEAYAVIRDANPFPSVCARVCNHPCETRCRSGASGGEALAIRTLKRFITDKIDPADYKPGKKKLDKKDVKKIAVIGAGPAGLSAAHYLSLAGHKVTVFESESKPGGMLICGIPEYRLPRDVLDKEIGLLLDKDVELKINTRFGKDITVKDLKKDGFDAIFLSIGSHKSRRLNIPNEDAEGVYQGMKFLKEFNLNGKELASGRVCVIGGGNSAIDAARVAIRQKGVESVTVLYRRSKSEMPAFKEEIDAAIEEGVELKTMVSPVAVVKKGKKLSAVQCVKNQLGDFDSSGRRSPVMIKGTEYDMEFDTLIAAIGEYPDSENLKLEDGVVGKSGNANAHEGLFTTSMPGVFAGGDFVTGSNTVIDAIAAGKKVAQVIAQYLRGEALSEPVFSSRPSVNIEMSKSEQDENPIRVEAPCVSVETRKGSFAEVEQCISAKDAIKEARRCLRCDLELMN